MNNLLRVLLIVVGGALLLPGACSMGYTPLTVMSLFGYDIGLGDAFGMFLFGLYFTSIGYALALGGAYLLRAAVKGELSEPPAKWLIAGGALLLMPGVSALILLVQLIQRLSEGRGFAPETYQMMAVAPVFAVIGAFLLWRAWRRRPAE